MPWKIADVSAHKKGLTTKQKKQWVRIANSVLARCLKKGGTDKTCAPLAIKQANGVVGNVSNNSNLLEVNKLVNYNYFSVNTVQEEEYDIEIKIHQGKPYLIVPVVMMVEGVHNGNHGPILHLDEELGKFPESWDGRPAVINHPEVDGIAVSANSPDIIDGPVVGRIYNTKIEDGLRAEIWIDEDKLNDVSPELLADINEGKPIEVSAGMFIEEEAQEGLWHEENYIAIARNIRPDHLALLPDAEGACSIEDGCGIRNNKKGDGMEIKKAVQTLQSEGYSIQRISNYAEQGYRELMDLVYDKLRSMDSQNIWHNLEELYEDSLIYSKSGDANRVMFKQGYKLSDGKIEFIGQPVEVKKETKYVVMEKSSGKMIRTKFSVNNNKKEGKMSEKVKNPCCEDLVDELIANKRTKYDADDKEWMLTLEETQLQKMIPEKEKEPEPEVKTELKNEPVVQEKVKEKEPEKKDSIESLSAEDKAALAYGRKQLKERREAMIKGIQDNAGKEVWPDDVLATYDEDSLERIYKSVIKEEVVDYSLNNVSSEIVNNEQEALYPTGVEVETK